MLMAIGGAWITSVAWADPLSDAGPLSFQLNAEARLRYEARDELTGGAPSRRLLTRGLVAASARNGIGVRGYGEIVMGEVSASRRTAAPNLRNAASLQQLWLGLPVLLGGHRAEAIIGRQEFDDGPRQLLSVSDGPNLHRTWNGARLALKERGVRWGAFAFRATELGRHGFDERVSRTESLSGITAGIALPRSLGLLNLDPFWLRTAKSGVTSDTVGARVWGQRGAWTCDVSAAVQSRRRGNRESEAWAVFASQSIALTKSGWKPRVGVRVDAASGGGADPTPAAGRFDPLYASSSYLGEGLFLSASNLFMVSPGFSFTPTAQTKVGVDYGFARRLDERDAVFAGQLRAYPGTNAVRGREIGGLFRATFNWNVNPRVGFGFDYEHLSRGEVLARAELSARRYAHGSVTLRY